MKKDLKIGNYKLGVCIDVGHSAVKCGCVFSDAPNERKYEMFETIVIDYFRHDSEETRQSIEKTDMVEVRDKKYFFGKTAKVQGAANSYSGQEKDWIVSEEHDVLIAGAWKRIHNYVLQKRKELPSSYVVVLGLPTKYFSSQKDILIQRVRELLTPYLAETQNLHIIVKAQSEAPLACLAFNEIGLPTSSLNQEQGGRKIENESWGIIESGFKTTDFSVWYEGQIINRLSDSTNGAVVAYEELGKELVAKKILTNVNGVLTKVIETKHLTFQGENLDLTEEVEKAAKVLQRIVIEKSKQIFSEHEKLFTGIIVAGGSTHLIFDALKEKYGDRVYTIPRVDPRFVVLEGFSRIALYAMNVQKVKAI